MHYLITGGCGFIGSHLTELLLGEGHKVTIVDDLSTGKRENIPQGVALKVVDINTPGVFDEYIDKVDGCFHLAAIVSVQKSAEEWLRTHQVNQSGLVALLDVFARGTRKIPVVLASSAAVYGDCADLPLKETASCTPLSAYGVDKLACEWQAKIATLIHQLPTIALRFFNVYGPRQDPLSPYSGVISIFANRFRQHQPVTIYGDGGQTRDFIYVGDIARGLFLSMKALEGKQLSHGVFNLCMGVKTSVSQLAQAIVSLTGSRSEITHAQARIGDIRHSLGDSSAAKKMLGFEAKVSLQDGLALTLKAL